jgi:hypothetical protein
MVTELLRCSVYDAFVVRNEAFTVADALRILQQARIARHFACDLTLSGVTVGVRCFTFTHGGRPTS